MAAVALRQVGIDAVVYERSTQLGEVGAGMIALAQCDSRVAAHGITARYSGTLCREHTLLSAIKQRRSINEYRAG